MGTKLSGLYGTEEEVFPGLQKAPKKMLFVLVKIEQQWRMENPLPEENINFLRISCT